MTDEMRHVYDVVLEAQQLALEAMKPGAVCSDMDAVARRHIEAAGYGEYFGHSLGHATGLQIHEAPGCSWANHTVLESGMSMTVEPGIYLPGRFGVRIEDLVIIEPGGSEQSCARGAQEAHYTIRHIKFMWRDFQ